MCTPFHFSSKLCFLGAIVSSVRALEISCVGLDLQWGNGVLLMASTLVIYIYTHNTEVAQEGAKSCL